MKVLVINCGSSSLKYQLINMENESVLAKGLCERIGIEGSVLTHSPEGKDKAVIEQPMPDHKVAVKLVLDALVDEKIGVISDIKEISAVGHRVVHGGTMSASTVIDDAVKQSIKDCFDLAPLHNPANLIGIEACEAIMPGVPQVAVFDTAFHQTMPEKAYMYAIPNEYYTKYGVRRYGFHGTSHSFVSKKMYEITGLDAENSKVIVCHLGNGASISAIKDGKCVDTSMGFTPLAGVVMGTRSGDIDVSLVPYVMEKEGKSVGEIMDCLNKKSGFLGISELSSDSRDIENAVKEGNEQAILAQKMFVNSVVKYISQYYVELGGCDVIAFTAGIGENSAPTRLEIIEELACLGIKLDVEANNVRGEVKCLSSSDSTSMVYLVPTNEELMIAMDTLALIK